MKKIMIILLSAVVLMGMTKMCRSNKIINDKYSFNKNSISIMVYDEESSSYIKQDHIPIGDYELNEEQTYCLNGGSIVTYDNNLGKIKYVFTKVDDCYVYFDSVSPFSFSVNGYDLLWEAYDGAIMYYIYSDGQLLTTTTNAGIANLYLYYDTSGTYNITVNVILASGKEVASENNYDYTILPYTHGYTLDTQYDYVTGVPPIRGSEFSVTVPDDVVYINFIDLVDLWQSGKYPDGTYTNLAVGGCKTTYLTNIQRDFCVVNNGLCLTQLLTELEAPISQAVIVAGDVTDLDYESNFRLVYDSSTNSLILKGNHSTAGGHFAFQFIVPGTVPSPWEQIAALSYGIQS